MSASQVNPLVYESLPPAEAQYQLDHVHESRVSEIVSTLIICLVIATLAVVLRFVSRRMVKATLKGDDWMMLVALVFALGYIISTFLCIKKYGGGRHAILLKNPIKFAQSVLAVEVFYTPAISSVKISTLLLFNRIFPIRRFRILLWSVGIFIVTYSAIQVLATIFQCRPIRAAWDTTVKAQCIQINLLFMIMAGMNVLTDIILLIAPLPTLWSLQMPRAMKYQLMGIFCIGGFSLTSILIVSIYRIPKLHGLSLVDAPWSNADATIWSIVEICVAIACACSITYRPLFNLVFRLNVPAAGVSSSERSGKSSRPSLGRISSPRIQRGAWEDIEDGEFKMEGFHTVGKREFVNEAEVVGSGLGR
ncbi:hypothetical protein MMC21_007995 [Puttea exsequens]|nr:hypothetical protein [Puttea exsequens]